MPDNKASGNKAKRPGKPPSAGLMHLLKPYKVLVSALVALTIVGNGLNLVVPKLISHAIDSFTAGQFELTTTIWQFLVTGLLVFTLTYAQSIVQTWIRNESRRICARASPRRSRPIVCVGGRNHTSQTADESHVGRGFGEDVRIHGDRNDHCVAVSHRRRERAVAFDQLAAGAGHPRHRAIHCDYVPAGAAKGARAVQTRSGGHRLAEPRDQRKHSGRAADPASQYAAP